MKNKFTTSSYLFTIRSVHGGIFVNKRRYGRINDTKANRLKLAHTLSKMAADLTKSVK